MKYLKSNQGFSLVQVLLAAGLFAMLGMSMATLIQNMWIENKSLQNKNSEISLYQTLSSQLSTKDLCFTALTNKTNFDPTQTVRPLVVQIGAESIATDAVLNKWQLKINSFNLTNISLAILPVGTVSTYIGNIEIQAESTSGRKMNYKNNQLGKLFLVVDNPTRTITSCYASEYSTDVLGKACTQLGGKMIGSQCNLDTLRTESLAAVGLCPSGQILTGMNATGSKICEAPVNKLASAGSCPGGTTVAGFNSNGTVYCAPNPAAPTPPPAKVCTTTGNGNCCPGGSGRCAMTGNVTEHTGSGGRGGYDNIYANHTCFCN